MNPDRLNTQHIYGTVGPMLYLIFRPILPFLRFANACMVQLTVMGLTILYFFQPCPSTVPCVGGVSYVSTACLNGVFHS